MDLNVLRTFVAVCEYAGFSAAGEKLGYTQSTVSSQIRQLEKELGVTLFDRFYHRIGLTEDGRCALRYARQILEAQEKLEAELHQPEQVTGELRLAMSNSVCARYFGSDYLAFRARYPGIRLKITQTGTTQMFDMLRRNEVDLVFTLDSHIYDSEFEICAEREERVHFVAAPGHPFAHERALSLRELVAAPFVTTEKGMSYQRLLEERLAAESLELQPLLEISGPEQIASIVAQSDMVAFLPDFTTRAALEAGRLVHLPVADCAISVWLQLLVHRNKWRSPALRALIEFYQACIAESADGI